MSGTSHMRRVTSAPASLNEQGGEENMGQNLHENEENASFIMMLMTCGCRILYWILTFTFGWIFGYTDRQEDHELPPIPQPHRRTTSAPSILLRMPSPVARHPMVGAPSPPSSLPMVGAPSPTASPPIVGAPSPPAHPLPPIPARHRFVVLRVLAITGAITVGYANSFIGGVFGTPIFVHGFFRSMYHKQIHARSTDFCAFADFRFLVLASTMPFCVCLSLWMAFIIGARWGPRSILWSGTLLHLVGAASTAIFPTSGTVITGVITIGLGSGFHIQAIPTICEGHVPNHLAKSFGILFSYQCLGSALAYAINLIGSYHPIWGWRLPFAVLAGLALILFGVSLGVNETPKHLIGQGRNEEAQETLREMRVGYPTADIDAEWADLMETANNNAVTDRLEKLLSYDIRPILVITAAAVLLPRLVATVPVMFFGPLVSTSLGPIKKVQFVTPFIAGLLGVLVTLAVTGGLHKYKSRRLLLVGASIVIMISQIGLWIIFSFFIDPLVKLRMTYAVISAALLIMNSAANTVLVNPHGWINCSVPGAIGPMTGVLLSSFSFFFIGLMNIVSVNLLCLCGGWLFMVNGGFAVITLVFLYYFVPETTRVNENMLARLVWRPHWFWKRFMVPEENV